MTIITTVTNKLNTITKDIEFVDLPVIKQNVII